MAKSRCWIYKDRDAYAPDAVKTDVRITTIQVVEGAEHDRVHVWNRGALAGTLTVKSGDGRSIARFLMPSARREEA